MRQIIYIIGILLLGSCAKNNIDYDYIAESESDTPFTITLSSDDAFSSLTSTRAELDDVYENEILNVWILMFDSKGKRLEQSSYEDSEGNVINYGDRKGTSAEDAIFGSIYIEPYESQQIVYIDKTMSTKIAYIRVVANTFNAFDENDTNTNFSIDHCTSIKDYEEKYFALSDNANRENDMWQDIDGKKYLRMAGNWGYVEGTDAEGNITNVGETMPKAGLDFCLGVLAKPMAAKLSITYTVKNQYVNTANGEGVRITSVQVKRVPNKCYYKDVEDTSISHNFADSVYTSYQPRYAEIDGGLGDYEGTADFYVPQNMRGNAVGYVENVTNLSASDKSNPEYIPNQATCVVITGMYKAPFDSDSWASQEEQPIYIELYPGDNNNNYDVKLRRHYKINCTITPNVDGVDWDADYRIAIEGDLPGAPIVHYEFNPNDHQYNSAYEPVDDGEGNVTYELMNMNYPAASGSYTTDTDKYSSSRIASSTYLQGYQQYYDPSSITSVGNKSTTDHTTNIIANEGKRFLRNLAAERDAYDGYNGRTDSNGVDIPHPQIFDCTYLKDHYERYVGKSSNHYDKTYVFADEYLYNSGRLEYYKGNNFIGASLLQLCTGWGCGLDLTEKEFTIVFIGSVGSNPYQRANQDRGVYYGNTLHNDKRWYFYKFNYKTDQTLTLSLYNPSINDYVSTTETYAAADYVSFGLGQRQTSPIDALEASSYQNVQAYDICNTTARKVYFNNVDVKDAMFSNYEYFPYTDDYEFEAPIYIFGHDTPSNRDDAIDGRLRLFLVYDYALSLDEIDQIRKYAVLKGLLKYGEDDIDKFDISVDAFGTTESSWDDGYGYDTEL